MSKRSQQRRMTPSAKVLRYMRHKSGLSVNQAGRLCGISGSAIAHIEHGRMDIPEGRVETLVKGYGFAMADFHALLCGSGLPANPRDECIAVIRELSEAKVAAVYGILMNFAL